MMEILDAKISNKINLVWYSDDIQIIQHFDDWMALGHSNTGNKFSIQIPTIEGFKSVMNLTYYNIVLSHTNSMVYIPI